MSASLQLVAKILPASQKATIALALADDLENPTNSSALGELISEIDDETLKSIIPQLKAYCLDVICSGDAQKIECAIKFANFLEEIRYAILEQVLVLLRASLEGIYVLNTTKMASSQEALEKDEMLNLMTFLSSFYVNVDLLECPLADNVDLIFLLFLGHVEDEISSQCSKVVRWRIESLVQRAIRDESFAKYLWGTIFDLLKPLGTKQHAHNSFILWLRILSAKNAHFRDNTFFQHSIVCQNSYWKTLQDGLAGASHEIRKFCLSILQLSLKFLNHSFETEVLRWNVDEEEEGLEEWSTYTTLFEIVGIDTSLHQTQGAENEILELFTPESRIHPSWGFCLLCTGFQSSMDSVRKFSAQLLLSIKSENLYLFKYGLPFLKGTFLPYMLQSSHFTVRPKGPFTNELACQYGEKVAEFLANLFRSLTSPEEFETVSSSILDVLVSLRETFDAVKIYTALGIVTGLAGKNALRYGVHDASVVKLFDNFSEGELFKRTLQSLVLKMIMCFKLDHLSQFSDLLSRFVSFNGHKLMVDNARLLWDYLQLSKYHARDIVDYLKSSGVSSNSPLFYLLLKMYASNDSILTLLEKADKSCMLTLAQYGVEVSEFSVLTIQLQQTIENALQGEEDSDVYRLLAVIQPQNLQLPEKFSIKDLWALICTNFQAEEFEELQLAVSKARFVNNIALISSDYINVEDLSGLYEVMFLNSDGLKSRNDYYKLKEDAFSQLHAYLKNFVQRVPEDANAMELVPLLHLGTTNADTLLAIVEIATLLLKEDKCDDASLIAIIFGLCESWEELCNERLKLSDKEMHWALIDMIFHPKVLDKAREEEFVNDALSAFAQSIIESSFGRRGLVPRMIKRISDYQVLRPEAFEEIEFIPSILVRTACHRQVSSHAFKMEVVMGDLYDSKISPFKSNIYEELYGPEEILGKVWLFAILNSIKTEKFALSVINAILDEEDTFRMVNITKQTDGGEEYVRCQLAKVILSVVDRISVQSLGFELFDQFNYFIENDPSPLVRIYFEWIIALQLLRDHNKAEIYFQKVADSLESHEIKPTVVTIYERILYLMIQSLDEKLEVELLTRLLTIIIPAASTNKAITRHFSMSLATSVHEEIARKKLPLNDKLVALVENMYKSAVASSAFGQYRSGDALLWDIVHDLDLVSISGGLLLRLSDREVEFITSEQFNRHLTEEQKSILNHPVGADRVELWVSKIKADQQQKKDFQEASSTAQMPLQTKSHAWSTVMDVNENTNGNDVKRSDLIVVASLVTKAPNLGGICRLCDVLGAGLMTVFDMKMTKNPTFKNVAVTADFWMPMKEVLPWDIRDFLRAKKVEGYTLIGLEQTDKSVVLNGDLQFPKKSLILLGREKEGIPGELLAELDLCVEIKQVGVVRSMNIQTATAVICHAYSLQHC